MDFFNGYLLMSLNVSMTFLNPFFFFCPNCNWLRFKLPPKVKPPLAKWKYHRWLKWAVSQNVIDLADYFVPIRYLRVISPLKGGNERVVRDKNDIAENFISANEIEQSEKFARRRTRSQRILSDLPTISKEEATENVSQWIDFNKMASYIMEAHLFYKLEYFQCSIQVTDDVLKIASENNNAEVAKAAAKEIGKEKTGTSAFRWNSKQYILLIKRKIIKCTSILLTVTL